MHPHWYVSLSACAGHLRKSFGCSVCWLCARAPTHIDTPTCTQTLTDDRCCSCHPGPTPTHTLAVLYILVISHATFPQRPEWHTRPGRLHCCRSVHLGDLFRDVSFGVVPYLAAATSERTAHLDLCDRQSCPHSVGHPQAPEDKGKRGHRHCGQFRRCTVQRLLPPPTHPFAAGAGSGGTNKCRTCPGSSLFLAHFPSVCQMLASFSCARGVERWWWCKQAAAPHRTERNTFTDGSPYGNFSRDAPRCSSSV